MKGKMAVLPIVILFILGLVIACAPQEPTVEVAAEESKGEEIDESEYEELSEETWDIFGGSGRVVCLVFDDGSTSCLTISDFTEGYKDIFGLKLAYSALLQVLDELDEETRDKILGVEGTDTILVCPGGMQSVELNTDIRPQPKVDVASVLDGTNLNIAVEACKQGLEEGFDLVDFGLGLLGDSDSNYNRLVDNTKGRMEEGLDSCFEGPANAPTNVVGDVASAIMAGEAHYSPYTIVLGAYFGAIAKSFSPDTKLQRENGIKFRLEGRPISDCGGNSTCKTWYEVTDKACEGSQSEECAPKPEEPKPEEPKPEEPGPGTGTGTTQCVDDETCSSICENRRAAWEQFKQECDRVNWETYTCKSYVFAMNACPDPGTILPVPDKDFQCIRPSTDKELRAEAYVKACEEVQGVYSVALDSVESTTGDRHLELECIPLDDRGLSVEEVYTIIMERRCLYMLTDEGICTGEISVDVIGVEPEPIPVPYFESPP